MSVKTIQKKICDNKKCRKVVRKQVCPEVKGAVHEFDNWINGGYDRDFCCVKCAKEYWQAKEETQ